VLDVVVGAVVVVLVDDVVLVVSVVPVVVVVSVDAVVLVVPVVVGSAAGATGSAAPMPAKTPRPARPATAAAVSTPLRTRPRRASTGRLRTGVLLYRFQKIRLGPYVRVRALYKTRNYGGS
jgi:hypothetical protein